jgi:hypothetical protein
MDEQEQQQTVCSYFRERAVNGRLLLCVDETGEPTAHLERGSNGDVEAVIRGARHEIGSAGLTELWQVICWTEGRETCL